MPRKKTGRVVSAKTASQLNRDITAALNGGNPGPKWAAGSKVQSLLFDRARWTPSTAKTWARGHGYKSGKVHVTDNYVRLRQFAPVARTQKRTISFGSGIKAVIEQVT